MQKGKKFLVLVSPLQRTVATTRSISSPLFLGVPQGRGEEILISRMLWSRFWSRDNVSPMVITVSYQLKVLQLQTRVGNTCYCIVEEAVSLHPYSCSLPFV